MISKGKIEELLSEYGCDALFISSRPNVFYLSRFVSTNAYIVLTKEERIFITDGRYYEGAKSKLNDWNVVLLKGPLKYTINTLLRERGVKRVVYEKERVTCSMLEGLKMKGSGIEWIGIENPFKYVRSLKSREEIDTIREAVKITDEVYKRLMDTIGEGMREKDIRRKIVDEFLGKGAEGESFPSIVAFGPNSAIPHWTTSDTPVGKGPLLIDMGMVWKGYCSDFTRTLYIGKPDEEFNRVYTIVRDAHLKAVDKVKEGVKVGDVDRVAREYIEKKGYGEFFVHSTGHGIGVEIHEYPRVYYKGKDAKDILKEGMVFTIEPGIYLPGKFGVRLENIVVVERDGVEVMSSIPLDLVVL